MGRLDGLRVLVVEDVKDVRAVLKRLLEMEGAVVVATGSGREAISLATESSFGIVLTDLGLPDIAGDFVIRYVKSTSPRPWVVVATGYGEPYLGRAKAAGADLIFTKPLAWSALLSGLMPAPSARHAA